MKIFFIMFFAFSLFCLQASNSYAQSGVVSVGGDQNGAGYSISFSVGQVDYIPSFQAGSGSVNAGIQQPFEFFTSTGVKETGNKDLSFFSSVYPNPTDEYVTLQIEGMSLKNLSYQLYDMQGKLLMENSIDGNLNKISLSDLPNAMYFMKILHQNIPFKTIKIIKTL